jgi:hypothetical protein
MHFILKDEQSAQEMSKRSYETLIGEASKLFFEDEPDLEVKAETNGKILTEEPNSDRSQGDPILNKDEKKEIKKQQMNSSNEQEDEDECLIPATKKTKYCLDENKEDTEGEASKSPRKTYEERFTELDDDDLKQFVVNKT